MPSFIQRLVQRRLTEAFIERDEVVVVLTPHAQERTNNGGWRLVDGPPRRPQRVSLVAQGIGTITEIGAQREADGQQLLTQSVMVMSPTAVVEVGDYWISDGTKYEVTYIYPENGYERRATVVKHG